MRHFAGGVEDRAVKLVTLGRPISGLDEIQFTSEQGMGGRACVGGEEGKGN